MGWGEWRSRGKLWAGKKFTLNGSEVDWERDTMGRQKTCLGKWSGAEGRDSWATSTSKGQGGLWIVEHD